MEGGCCLQVLWLSVRLSRWFNLEIVDDFSADERSSNEGEDVENEQEEEKHVHTRIDAQSVSPFPDESRSIQPADCTWSIQQGMLENECLNTEQLRIAVGTWNVAGRIPPSHLDLKDWLGSNHPPGDIYIVGFQEIVPLNVGNVFSAGDMKPATKRWQSLIRHTLNSLGEVEQNSTMCMPPVADDSCNDDTMEDETLLVRPLLSTASSATPTGFSSSKKQGHYVRVVSKQMVGIHISVWVHRKLYRFIDNLSVSCIGLGLMGCLGNKGSISVSMTIHQSSFCFICAHLTPGSKRWHEERRNRDATEVLKRTHFPVSKGASTNKSRNILGHDQIVWFGDLNYRLNLLDKKIRFLVAQEDWANLLKEDQLQKHSKKGHIFEGWHEGIITFGPTYKYKVDSNDYAGGNVEPGEMQRSPAWCDRILWHGTGLKLLTYKRGESTFSDHRPVLAVFLAVVEVLDTKSQKAMIDQAFKTEG